MALNRIMKAAMGAGRRAGVSQEQMSSAIQRMMGQGGRVKSAPNPANPARTRNFATDAATGRHRSISKATADRYASYGKTKAKANAARTATAGGALAAAMAVKGNNPQEAEAEERNPAEERNERRGPSKRGRPTKRRNRKGGRGDGRAETERRKGYADGRRAERKASSAKPDSKSFNDAFKAARAAYKSGRSNATSFKWRGKSYSIVTKDDIKKAGAKDLREYLNKGGKPSR